MPVDDASRDDAAHPSACCGRAPELTTGPPGALECVLHGVLGVVLVARQTPRKASNSGSSLSIRACRARSDSVQSGSDVQFRCPITSGLAELVHAGSVGSVQPFRPDSAWAMNPFIFPAAMSAVALLALWGPPPLTSAWSTYSATHAPEAGSGTHTVGLPCFIGMPSAPG